MYKTTKAFLCFIMFLSFSASYAHQKSDVKSIKADADSTQTIKPYKSNEIKVYKSKEIEPYKSSTIEIYKSKTIQPDKSGSEVKSENTSNTKSNSGNTGKNEVSSLIGVWHTNVPGAVYQTPSNVQGYDKLHVSSGVKSGDLIINSNGTYKWNSYGGKSGRWMRGDKEYPVVLIDNQEHKKWKVGLDQNHSGGRDIIIWDGYVWYNGKR